MLDLTAAAGETMSIKDPEFIYLLGAHDALLEKNRDLEYENANLREAIYAEREACAKIAREFAERAQSLPEKTIAIDIAQEIELR